MAGWSNDGWEWGESSQQEEWAWSEQEPDRDYQENHQGEAWEEARQAVKGRDEACQLCGTTEEEQRDRPDLWGEGLHVHHIEPVSSFDDPDDAHHPDNMILLCAACHRAVERGEKEVPGGLPAGGDA